jgi:hypothetical protein
MCRFLELGVNGIFTNKPDILKKAVADVKQSQKAKVKAYEYIKQSD